MTPYWQKQMDHAPTAHYYAALTRMVEVLKKGGNSVERVLEIGTGWGISGSVFLEEGCKSLLTIDPNMKAGYVRQSIEELNSKVGKDQKITYVNAMSRDLVNHLNADDYFDVIFVDGMHDYEGVKKDIYIAKDHLATGGVIICDDYTHPKNGSEYGVARAVDEYLEKWNIIIANADYGVQVPRKRLIRKIEDRTGNGLVALIHQ